MFSEARVWKNGTYITDGNKLLQVFTTMYLYFRWAHFASVILHLGIVSQGNNWRHVQRCT